MNINGPGGRNCGGVGVDGEKLKTFEKVVYLSSIFWMKNFGVNTKFKNIICFMFYLFYVAKGTIFTFSTQISENK